MLAATCREHVTHIKAAPTESRTVDAPQREAELCFDCLPVRVLRVVVTVEHCHQDSKETEEHSHRHHNSSHISGRFFGGARPRRWAAGLGGTCSHAIRHCTKGIAFNVEAQDHSAVCGKFIVKAILETNQGN